jgi:hypothetical protein
MSNTRNFPLSALYAVEKLNQMERVIMIEDWRENSKAVFIFLVCMHPFFIYSYLWQKQQKTGTWRLPISISRRSNAAKTQTDSISRRSNAAKTQTDSISRRLNTAKTQTDLISRYSKTAKT